MCRKVGDGAPGHKALGSKGSAVQWWWRDSRVEEVVEEYWERGEATTKALPLILQFQPRDQGDSTPNFEKEEDGMRGEGKST